MFAINQMTYLRSFTCGTEVDEENMRHIVVEKVPFSLSFRRVCVGAYRYCPSYSYSGVATKLSQSRADSLILQRTLSHIFLFPYFSLVFSYNFKHRLLRCLRYALFCWYGSGTNTHIVYDALPGMDYNPTGDSVEAQLQQLEQEISLPRVIRVEHGAVAPPSYL